MPHARSAFATLMALLAALTIAACGGSDDSSAEEGGRGARTTAALEGDCGQLAFTPPREDPDDVFGSVLEPLGEDVAAAYDNYAAALMQSSYADFKAKDDGPWTIGYSDSFSGNAWRAAALSAVRDNFAAAKEQGIVAGDLIVTDSNLKNDVQIQQMRSMIQRGVDLILAIPGSPTALNGVIKQAHDAGVGVVTLNSPVTSPYAINVDANAFLGGARMAQGLVYLLGGEGRIMTVQGLAGSPASKQIEDGGNAIFDACSGIDVVANYDGSWNNATAKTATLQALATHSGELDGVWQQGSMEKGIIEAFEQQGRDVPTVTMGNPDQAGLAYWNEHEADGYRGVATTSPSAAGGDAMFRVGIRVLEGKGPKVNAIVGAPPLILAGGDVEEAGSVLDGVEIQALADWMRPGWTFDSPGVANPSSGPDGTWLNDALLDKLFERPGTDYAGIPDAGQD